MTSQSIGKILRVSNLAGPCIEEGTITGETEKFYVVAGDTGPRRFRKDSVGRFSRWSGGTTHILPCVRCTDHPETHYPNGYEN
jgi:hypothetical protein